MGMFDDLASRSGNLDLAGIGAKVGLSQEQVQQVLGVLGQAQAQPGDTAENAANASGLPLAKVQALIEQLGGGSLGGASDLLGNLGGIFNRG